MTINKLANSRRWSYNFFYARTACYFHVRTQSLLPMDLSKCN